MISKVDQGHISLSNSDLFVAYILEMGIEPKPNRTHRTRTLLVVEPNRTRTSDGLKTNRTERTIRY